MLPPDLARPTFALGRGRATKLRAAVAAVKWATERVIRTAKSL
jgi:hypothetical protein